MMESVPAEGEHHEGHTTDLSECCRICGTIKRRKERAFHPAAAFENEILSIYEIDIANDNKDIHPHKICNSCRMKFFHFRNQKSKKDSFEIRVPKLFEFQAHSSNCKLCSRQAGRPSSDHTTIVYKYQCQGTGVAGGSESMELEQTPSIHVSCASDTAPVATQKDFTFQGGVADQPGPSLSSDFQPTSIHIPANTQLDHDSTTDTDTEPEPDTKKFKPSSIYNVTKTLNFSEDIDASEMPSFTEITSISIDRAVEKSLADIVQCSICQGIPTEPVVTTCSHIFCRTCLSAWLKSANACPVCRGYLDYECFDILRGQLALMYDTLHITCTYDNCQSTLLIKDVKSHENHCKYGKYPKLMKPASEIKRGESLHKIPIYDCKAKYIKQKRLKLLIDSTDDFCKSKNENKLDVLFFMTLQHLKSTNDDRAESLESLWRDHTNLKLTGHHCLAIRIDTLQSKAQYRSQFEFLKLHGSNPFQSPHILDNIECQYAPASVRYSLEGHEFANTYYHTPMKSNQTETVNIDQPFEPIDILTDFSPCLPEIATPNVKGCRWQYPDALAKTLAELEPDILKGLKDNNIDSSDPTLLLKTYVKDGADGLGDVAVHKEVSDRFLPDKAFRFSFCVFKIEASVNNGEFVTIFTESKPNSVRTNRPLLEAICDENNHGSSTLCLLGIENERSYMKNKILRVQADSGWLRHTLYFTNSMIDEKLDRANSGLAGSGSSYLCTLCDATRDTAVSQLGGFSINRTYDETSRIAQYVKLNPDNLKKSDLDKLSKGIKNEPLLTADAIEKGLDATHADINCGSFFKKIIVREVAEVNKWEMTEDVKPIIKDAEVKFDMHIKSTIGINPQLMMPGNYSRMLFEKKNESHVLYLIKSSERKHNVKMLLEKFRFMRTVYRATDPKVQYPQETKLYKQTAVEFGRDLINNFDYARWPNYIHKVIEHVQELIENPNGPGTVGGLSGEGNEGGNKIFRHFRLHLARKGNTYGGLRDVLWGHWLYSSPKLVRLAAKSRMQQRCSYCKSKGHNVRTCPVANK